MKKVGLAILYVFAVFSVLIVISCAADTEENGIHIVDTFYHDGKLDIYMSLSKSIQQNMKTGLMTAIQANGFSINNLSPKETGKLSQGVVPTYTIFLIDLSFSMEKYCDDVTEYISEIMNEANEKAQFSLASFGDKLNILYSGGNADSEKTINKTLQEAKYNEYKTNLYSNISEAIDYAENFKKNIDALVNILIITDGMDTSNEKLTTKDNVIEKLENSRILVHTLQISADVDASYTETLKRFSEVSGGFHSIYESDRDENIANEFNQYLSNIYYASFEFDISSSNIENEDTIITGTVYFTFNGNVIAQQNFKHDVTTNRPSDEMVQNEDESEIGVIEDPEDGIIVINENYKEITTDDTDKSFSPVIIIVSIGGFIVIAATAVIICKYKYRRRSAKNIGIYMKLFITSGEYKTKKTEFYLRDQLIIGRNPHCDIVFKNLEVSNENSKIFINEDVIYIEDLNSVNGTNLNGMKLFSYNRLRSGDEISIGEVSFTLRF